MYPGAVSSGGTEGGITLPEQQSRHSHESWGWGVTLQEKHHKSPSLGPKSSYSLPARPQAPSTTCIPPPETPELSRAASFCYHQRIRHLGGPNLASQKVPSYCQQPWQRASLLAAPRVCHSLSWALPPLPTLAARVPVSEGCWVPTWTAGLEGLVRAPVSC